MNTYLSSVKSTEFINVWCIFCLCETEEMAESEKQPSAVEAKIQKTEKV